ncbi:MULTISPECIES: hypothetical protein [unclassified Pseudofrankia]|uniref:hypothetical protein n=1 Tax=unclassified Pseudofrankia TaxID=2994372 RepID=UPI0008DAD554|nr:MULTISPECIES: hypothetical protein [unclassified Pseudofrankia]MDT3441187.1 hypothetical protein [Pseudofrankia sp. BMG5.37]OHV54226.1 hypothetical protein BCD48_09045 [Pseudofrankia sp. BMG5.36]
METHSIGGQARRSRHSWTVAAGALGLGAVVLLAACSDSSDSPAAAATPSASASANNTQAACAAALASDWSNVPGIDPDGPPASAAELAAWATPLQTQITALRAGVPADLTSKVDVLATVVQGAKEGKPVSTEDASLSAALTAVNGWAHDSCGYTTLDVTNSAGTALDGVPATLPAGPVAMKFANTGTDPAKAGFILLLGKVRDGQTATAADVQARKANLEDIADIVAVAQPTGSDPAYGLATLSPGRYIVSTPVGPPPEFASILASGFEVS